MSLLLMPEMSRRVQIRRDVYASIDVDKTFNLMVVKNWTCMSYREVPDK